MKLFKKESLFFIIIILSLTWTTGVMAETGRANFSMEVVGAGEDTSPGYFVFDAEGGSIITGQVLVKNTGTAVGTARLYAVDTTTGQTGGTVFLMPQDPLEQAGTWITLETDLVTLDPGMGELVNFTVSVPERVRAGHHVGGLILESLEHSTLSSGNEGSNQAAFVVDVQTRSAMAVQVNVAGTAVSQLDVTGLRLGGHNGQQILYLTLRNSGNQMLKPTGTLKVYDDTSQTVQHLRFNLDTFLPDSEIEYPIYVQGRALGADDYLGDLRLRYQTGETVYAHQFNFTVSDEMNVQIFSAREAIEAPDFSDVTGNNLGQFLFANSWLTIALIIAGIGLLGLLSWQGLQLYRRRQIAKTTAANGRFAHQ